MKEYFDIKAKSTDDAGRFVYTVVLDADHDIFKGHFPGKPILPGVLTLMMVRKCAEDARGLGETRIANVKDAKYNMPIIPDGTLVNISFTIDDDMAIKGEVTNQEGASYTTVKMSLTK